VPGVLFCNRKIKAESPRLMDLGPTALDLFGVDIPAYMDGKPLTIADADGSLPSMPSEAVEHAEGKGVKSRQVAGV
jgi:hypothetical protein